MFTQSAPRNLCVIRLSAIGDTCHALAVVRNLQDNWPATGITWIIGKTEAQLLGDIADIEFIIFDKARGRQAYADVRSALHGRSFDAALCMHASFRANRLCRLIPAPLRLGFDWRRARDLQWLFTNQRIPATAEEHALDAMMGFARFIGAQPKPMRWDIPIPAAARQFADQHCQYPTLLISPLSSQRSRNYRNWPAERFAEVAQHAAAKHGARVVLTGGSSDLERRYGDEIAAACAEPVVNLIGQTTLKQLFALIAAADLVLAPDSGPVHMATAAGTPVIGLYATSNPRRTGPYVSRQLVVNRYPDALEKFLGKREDQVRWGQRVRDPQAMLLIEVDEVIARIDSALSH